MAKKNNFTISKDQKITFRTDSINRYFSDVTKIPRITKEREDELVLLVCGGDEKAKDELIKSNLRFVISIAKTFAHTEEMLEDLINEGNIGLIKAAAKFDPEKKIKFISYAVWWIRREMLTYINQGNKPIHFPANKVDDINRIRKFISKIEQELCRTVTIDDMINYFDGDDLITAQDAMVLDMLDIRSLDYITNDNESSYHNVLYDEEISSDSMVMESDRVNTVLKALNKLTTIEKLVITKRYGLMGEPQGLTYNEIALNTGIPQSTIRKHEDKALKKLKFRINKSLSYA